MCSKRRNECFATAKISAEEGATNIMGIRHIHSHKPQLGDVERQAFLNSLW